VVTRSSGRVYQGASGIRNLKTPDQKVTTDTVMWIASMSKGITSFAAMLCVDRGLVGLDDDLSTLIPELKNVQIIDRSKPFEDGNYSFKPAQKKITLRHMLTHSNGLIYSHWYEHGKIYSEKHGISNGSEGNRSSFKFPSWHEAGEEWHYGLGIDYAGLTIEAVTGKKLGDFMAENIFKPLGMTKTSFNMTPELKENFMSPYTRDANGTLVPIDNPIWPEKSYVEQEMGGGGLFSTASDYSKWLTMILNDGKAPDGTVIIRPETLKLALTGTLEPAAKVSCNEAHMKTQPTKWPKVKRDYALIGMTFEEDLPTGRAAGTVQWDGAPSCHWFVDRKNDIGAVQTVQMMPFGDPEVQSLFVEVEYAIYKNLKK